MLNSELEFRDLICFTDGMTWSEVAILRLWESCSKTALAFFVKKEC
jgi:hypothetical protein